MNRQPCWIEGTGWKLLQPELHDSFSKLKYIHPAWYLVRLPATNKLSPSCLTMGSKEYLAAHGRNIINITQLHRLAAVLWFSFYREAIYY